MYSSEFFRVLWNASEGENWYTPTMQDGVWSEGGPQTMSSAAFGVDPVAPYDQYITPLKYNGLRKKGLLGNPGVIFADFDNETYQGSFRLPPSIVVSSSPGHFHLYWLLKEPTTPELWAPRAKGWTAEIGADPGGWDATQVLRIPGTWNHKYDPPAEVWLASFKPELVYDLDQFPLADLGPEIEANTAPEPDRSRGQRLLADGINNGKIPLSSIYWLTASEEDIKALGTIDRSAILWQQERVLLEAGYTPIEVFDLLYHAGIDKWRGQPLKLWREINKAVGYGGR